MNDIKRKEKLFIVDLETVSMYSDEALENILNDDKKYLNTPFLFLISSLVRNKAMLWASQNFQYKNKIKTGSWVVYCFEKI